MIIIFSLILIIGYFLGSIPSGYLIGKLLKKIDIRDFGSGNVGFANALRVLGLFPGLLVLTIDIAKGVVSVYLGILLAPLLGFAPQVTGGISGLLSILGHNWPIFLKFRGGKGVAVTAGVFLILTPLPFLFSALTMVGVIVLTRYVSLGSMTAVGSLPFFIWFWMPSKAQFCLALSIVGASLILFRHRSNIERLLRGKERKIGEKVKI
ncbi:Glycerol-3-phosphate acyltransferase [subsurface metagenome]